MFFLLIFCVSVYGELCTTPLNELGECVPIRSCFPLLRSFTNPKSVLSKYLQKFVCSNGDLGLTVCCRLTSDYLVSENDEIGYLSDPDDVAVVDLPLIKECGILSNSAKHPESIDLQTFPGLVKIARIDDYVDREDQVNQVGCTGVLINRLYVLYSAQCHVSFWGENITYFVSVERARNPDCNQTLLSSSCNYFESYVVDQYTIHPFYDAQTKINDIAIIRVNRPIQFSADVQPICLPIFNEPVKMGQTVYTVGWSRALNTTDTSVKKIQSSVLISNLDCQNRLIKSGSNASISLYEMCTFTEEKNVDGDIIGPPLMSLEGNQWYLQGFESQGKNPKIYTRVQNYLQWIKEAMGGERCLTPYNETGECRILSDCPKLMDAFANASPNDEEALKKFICTFKGKNPNDKSYVLEVCCGITPDFKIPPETNAKNLDYELSNYNYCGFQHRDDYFSSRDDISVNEFPWLAIIISQKSEVCGGSLITSRYVLTAAQYISKFSSVNSLVVRLGDYNLKQSEDCVSVAGLDELDCTVTQEYGVEKQITHPFFNYYNYLNDIALLRLNETVLFSDYIRPICLPRSEEDEADYGDVLFTTGFGNMTRKIEGKKLKKKIRTTLITIEECDLKIKQLGFTTPVTAYHLCSEDFRNSTDVTCKGDEGSPVMFSKNVRWFLLGVSSTYGCSDDEPQTHSRVLAYMKWIKMNTEN